jgi:hypothetical protein
MSQRMAAFALSLRPVSGVARALSSFSRPAAALPLMPPPVFSLDERLPTRGCSRASSAAVGRARLNHRTVQWSERMKKFLLILGLMLACCAELRAALPPGISGTWYNPAQSGHGVSIEVLDDERVLAFWYVYDLAGNPVHLYLDGRIEDRRIVATAHLSRGMRFGVFNPAEHQLLRWGSVTLDFSSCDAAQLSYVADGVFASYGSGTLPLQRLSRISGVGCSLTPAAAPVLAPGLMMGRWERRSGLDGAAPELQGAIDARGRLWAAPRYAIDSTYQAFRFAPPVLLGESGSTTTLTVHAAYNEAFSGARPRSNGFALPLQVVPDGSGLLRASATSEFDPNLLDRVAFERDSGGRDPLRDDDFDPARLVGKSFRFDVYTVFFLPSFTVRFLDRDSFCIDTYRPCEFTGEAGAVDENLAMFDVTLVDTRSQATFAGKAWYRADQDVLVMAAEDGLSGLGFVARAVP